MDRIRDMLRSHPAPAGSNGDEALACIMACLECATTCTTCADACLAESDAGNLAGCIRLNIDCADICALTARLIARPSHRDRKSLQDQLNACADACVACGTMCASHGEHMEHCRICAESCNACEAACRVMAGALVA